MQYFLPHASADQLSTGNLALLLLDTWLMVQKEFLFRDIEPPLQSSMHYCI